MVKSKDSDYETILQKVRGWPVAWRFALVYEVLMTLAPEFETSRHQRKTLQKALGLLSTDRPAPSDAEVRQWLEERRLKKYS